MQKMNRSRFTARRIAIDALFVALEFALSMLSSGLTVGGVKISLVALPIVLCALLYGAADAALIAFLGEFMMQMLGYGFTQTTILWCMPETLRGLLLGLCFIPFRRSANRFRGKQFAVYLLFCVLAAAVTSVGNTAVFYLDAKLFGYYSYALIFGVLWVRLALSGAIAVLTGIVALPVAGGLRKAGLI